MVAFIISFLFHLLMSYLLNNYLWLVTECTVVYFDFYLHHLVYTKPSQMAFGGRTTKYSLLTYLLLLLQYWKIITQTTLSVSGSGYCGLCIKLLGGGECLHEVELTLASSAAVERLFTVFSASAPVLTVRRCRMQDKKLDMHIFLRSILKHSKHDINIPDNLGTGQAVIGGSRE